MSHSSRSPLLSRNGWLALGAIGAVLILFGLPAAFGFYGEISTRIAAYAFAPVFVGFTVMGMSARAPSQVRRDRIVVGIALILAGFAVLVTQSATSTSPHWKLLLERQAMSREEARQARIAEIESVWSKQLDVEREDIRTHFARCRSLVDAVRAAPAERKLFERARYHGANCLPRYLDEAEAGTEPRWDDELAASLAALEQRAEAAIAIDLRPYIR